jgi:hypothetical protein
VRFSCLWIPEVIFKTWVMECISFEKEMYLRKVWNMGASAASVGAWDGQETGSMVDMGNEALIHRTKEWENGPKE